MEALGQYILSVTTASIFYGILRSLLDKKGTIGILIQLVGGVFLAFTVFRPVADIDFDIILDIPLDLSAQGDLISEQGKKITQTQLHDDIKQQCEAYILDKAQAYHTQIDVEIELCDDDIPIPTAAKITGNISPYAKRSLQIWIEDNMGIPRENQVWIG